MPVLRPVTTPAPTASHSLRLFTRVCWVVLGAVFIFSGLIKLNDPVGTAYKLEEYFEVFALDVPWAAGFFDFLKGQSRLLSIFLSSLEVMLGVALLLRWYLRQTLGVLLALLVFFGFLTFYSAAFNKVTDCGCFGDFLKLTPWASFSKDLFLLALWGVVFTNQRFLRHSFVRGTAGLMAMTVASALAIGIGVRALGHLPYFDFLPYKVGNNIAQQMKPAEAPRYRYTFERAGKTMESEAFPTDSTWKYKSMTVLNPEQSKAPITDFVVSDPEGNNITQQVLTGNKLLILIQNTNKADRDRFDQLNQLVADAAKSRKHIEVLAITSTSAGKFDAFRHEVNLAAPYAFADATVLKTMIRANPGLMALHDGTVMAKYHYHDIPKLYQVEKAL
ncbi:BT_3928 family protein [Hymenobacter polaris]|uniref:BT_3928 family protein n=1 Tax=Hymenobacter polaris TaxID=2682546 RepID=UPI001F5051CA|nr:BT_3928 family protein [Hymenobacter polaris]